MIMEPEAQKQEIIHVNNAFSVWVSQLVLQKSEKEDGQQNDKATQRGEKKEAGEE